MPPVITQGGSGFLLNPETGEVSAVPEARIGESLSEGFVPATEVQAKRYKIKEHYSGVGMGGLAALAGAARGFTFGGSDLVATGLGGVHPSTLRGLEQVHPIPSGVSELGGGVASFFVPGGVGIQAAKAGARVGVGAGKLAARAAAGTRAAALAPRIAAPVAREAFVGAAIGTGAAASDVILDEIKGKEAAARLVSGLVAGSATGLGLGVLAFGGSAAAGVVRKKLAGAATSLKNLRSAREKLTAEISALKARIPEGPPTRTIAQKLEALEGTREGIVRALQVEQGRAIGRVGVRAVAAGVAMGLDGGITGGILATLVAPKALNMLKKRLGPMFEGVGDKAAVQLGVLAERASPWASRARSAWGDVRGVPIVGDIAEGAAQAGVQRATAGLSQLSERAAQKVGSLITRLGPKAEIATESLGHGVGEAIAGAAMYGTPAAMLGGLVAGSATGLGIGVVTHKAAHHLQQIRAFGDLAIKKIVPVAKVTALEVMSQGEWRDLSKEIPHIDMEGMKTQIYMQAPDGVPDNILNSIVGQITKSVDWLKGQAPVVEKEAIPVGPTPEPDKEQNQEFVKKVKNVFKPDTLLESFIAGKDADISTGVKTWEAVHPQALEQLRAIVGAQVEEAAASGHGYSQEEGYRIALLLGTDPPGMYDPARIAEFQAMYQRPAAPGPGRPRGRPMKGAASSATQSQRVGLTARG